MTSLAPSTPRLLDTSTVRGKLLVPILIFVGLLVAIVSSLGAPLIPTIAEQYGVPLSEAQWTVTITLLVGAISAPIIGRIADGPKRRTILIIALAVLVIGGVIAAMPGSFALLLAGRALQGIGLSLLPVVMSIARDHLPPERSAPTVATLSVTAVVGLGLGYPAMGLIAQYFGFRAGFWVAAALGAVALVLVIVVVPPSSHRSARNLDIGGAVLLAGGLGAALLALSESEQWPPAYTWGASGVALFAIAAWIWRELRARYPLVELRLFRNRAVLVANFAGLVAGIGMYMLMSMMIRFVQTPTSVPYGFGATVVIAGLVLLPMSAGSFAASKVIGSLAQRLRPSTLIPIGTVLFATALLFFVLDRADLWVTFVQMGIAGFGVGCLFAVLPRMIVRAVPPEETSSALALHQVLRTVGYAVGSALSAAILGAHTAQGDVYPANAGYSVASVIAIGLILIAGIAGFAVRTDRPMACQSRVP